MCLPVIPHKYEVILLNTQEVILWNGSRKSSDSPGSGFA